MERRPSWKWYGVKTISRMFVGRADGKMEPADSLKESVVILRAQSASQAFKIAQRRARRKELRYRNIYGQPVCWRLQSIVDCYQFRELPRAGVEVYSCVYDLPQGGEIEQYLRVRGPRG